MYVKQENFHLNVRQNKAVLKELAAFLTGFIQRRSNHVPAGWDFRFMVIVAQWLVEQGGYTMTPEGNNPGNVVGVGDAGFFTRPYNTEFVNGVRVPRPDVKFARYSSMQYATEKKFDHLQNSWPAAYQAVLNGNSAEAYVSGLYPGHPKNYATAPKADYVNGVRYRLKRTIEQYIMSAEDDIKEMDELAGNIPDTPPPSGTSLDYRNNVDLNRNMRSVLENLVQALKDLQKRVKAGGNIQP
jgi:hypothetical protein